MYLYVYVYIIVCITRLLFYVQDYLLTTLYRIIGCSIFDVFNIANFRFR